MGRLLSTFEAIDCRISLYQIADLNLSPS